LREEKVQDLIETKVESLTARSFPGESLMRRKVALRAVKTQAEKRDIHVPLTAKKK